MWYIHNNSQFTDERRGVGGVFFDDLEDRPRDEVFSFVSDMVSTIVPAYLPIGTTRSIWCHSQSFCSGKEEGYAIHRNSEGVAGDATWSLC